MIQYKIHELKNKRAVPSTEEDNILIRRINKYTEKLFELKKRLMRHLENFDIRSAAILLNSNINEVYYRLNRIKEDLYRKLKDKLF